MASAALCACATEQVTRSEHQELVASVRALRSENARLESRLEKLESDATAARSKPPVEPRAGAAAVIDGVTPSEGQVPALAVVKLKPKKEAPPKIATEIEVVEPTSVALDDQDAAADPSAIEQQYSTGVEALKTGNAEGGVVMLRQFARDWPKHPKADNALFYAAIGLMAAREYKEAEVVLEQVVQSYPAGDATVDSLLKLADCRARLNRQADARATWEKIVHQYPGTSAASTAQARLASASRKE